MANEGKHKIRPVNIYMKVGLFSSVFFLLVSQSIIVFAVPANPSYLGALIEIGTYCNLLVFPAVAVLVFGTIKRRLDHPYVPAKDDDVEGNDNQEPTP